MLLQAVDELKVKVGSGFAPHREVIVINYGKYSAEGSNNHGVSFCFFFKVNTEFCTKLIKCFASLDKGNPGKALDCDLSAVLPP